MADGNVTIRLRVPAVDLSGLEGGTKRADEMREALGDLSKEAQHTTAVLQDLQTKQRQQGFLSKADQERAQQTQQRQQTQQVQTTQGQQSLLQTLQARLQGVQHERAGLPPGEEMRAHQLSQQEDRLRAHVARLQATVTTPPTTPVPPVIPTPPAAPVTPVTPPSRPAVTPVSPAQPASRVPPAQPATGVPATPMTRQHWDALTIRRDAMERRLTELQTRRATIPPGDSLGTFKARQEEDDLTARLGRVREELVRQPTRPAAPEEPIRPAPAGRPPRRPPRPPGPPEPLEDEERTGTGIGGAMRGLPGALGRSAGRLLGVGGGAMQYQGKMVGGAIGGVAGTAIGGVVGSAVPVLGTGIGAGIGGVVGTAIGSFVGTLAGLAADKVIDKAAMALERYEQRLRGVATVTTSLNMTQREVTGTIDTLREKYHFLAGETLEAMQSMGRFVGRPSAASTEAALRFSRAFGVDVATAGGMQGRMERLMAPTSGMGLRDITAAQMLRRDIPSLSNPQFLEQTMGIAGMAGTAAPAMSPAFATNMTNLIGGMGQRFPGQQANVYGRLSAGLDNPVEGAFQMMRFRAVQRLANRLPNGMLTIGEGKDAEQINLRTWRGQRKAMEMASQSPQLMEEYARMGEELGGSMEGLGADITHQMFAPNMKIFEMDRLLGRRGRGGLGPRGFGALDTPLTPGAGARAEGRALEQVPQTFKDIQEINARMEKLLEPMAQNILAAKVALETGLVKSLEGVANTFTKELGGAKEAATAASNKAQESFTYIGDKTNAVAEKMEALYQYFTGGQPGPGGVSATIDPAQWQPPPAPTSPVQPQRVQ